MDIGSIHVGGHLGFAVAHLVGGGGERERSRLRFDADHVRAVARKERHGADCLRELASRDPDRGRALTGDNLCVVWILAVDEPRGELGAAGAEEDLIAGFGDDDLYLPRLTLENPRQLGQGSSRNDETRLQLRRSGGGQLPDRQPVAVGGGQRQALALDLHQHAREHRPRLVGRGGHLRLLDSAYEVV